ncbi:MAG: hypothetical protein J5825_09725 [Lachnospiraceae bacterium]|nr:hypothetical protein [Lachnospiraceae bacterium]
MVEKTKKVTRILWGMVNLSPVIGAAVFAVLFAFVLQGRLEERILHSATTFSLWMFASLFYIMILANFKKVGKMIGAGLGMAAFILMAVIVTPLDRYVELIFSRSHAGAYLIAGSLVVLFYTVSILWRKKSEG